MIPLHEQYRPTTFAERAHGISTKEGLDGRPMADYVKLVNKHGGNLRAVFGEIEAGVMA